jgi:hypothetical protein
LPDDDDDEVEAAVEEDLAEVFLRLSFTSFTKDSHAGVLA